MQSRSWFGFIFSLLFHFCILALLAFAFQKEGAASSHPGILSTSISMEMMMATVAEPAQPAESDIAQSVPEEEPEPTPIAKSEPIIKDEVPDPTIQPEPKKTKEAKKSPPKEIKKEKTVTKQKNISKETEKKVDLKTDLPRGERTVISNANINSQATTTSQQPGNHPNLATNGSGSDEKSAYISALRREIERHKKYPQRAKMMRKQGVVTISFNVKPDGIIDNIKVSKSSGNEDLNNAALQAVRSARSVGPRPAGVSGSISVPINFMIQ